MPSLTVVVSSDTDICFSPGLCGLLADGATGMAADSFRAGPSLRFVSLHARTPGRSAAPACGQGVRHIDAMDIVKVT
jgi:hypothetical protein